MNQYIIMHDSGLDDALSRAGATWLGHCKDKNGKVYAVYSSEQPLLRRFPQLEPVTVYASESECKVVDFTLEMQAKQTDQSGKISPLLIDTTSSFRQPYFYGLGLLAYHYVIYRFNDGVFECTGLIPQTEVDSAE